MSVFSAQVISTQCIFIYDFCIVICILREASSPCRRDTILLNLPQRLLIILQELQSLTLSIQDLLQRLTEKSAALGPERHQAHVAFKVYVSE